MLTQREKTNNQLISKCEDIRRNIFQAKNFIQNFDPDDHENQQTNNLNDLRKLMESISIKTEKLKSSQAQAYESLMNEFSVYENELRALEKRLIYDTSIRSKNTKNSYSKNTKSGN